MRNSLLTHLLGHANIRVAKYDMSASARVLVVALNRSRLSLAFPHRFADIAPFVATMKV